MEWGLKNLGPDRPLNPPHKQAIGSAREPMALQFGSDA